MLKKCTPLLYSARLSSTQTVILESKPNYAGLAEKNGDEKPEGWYEARPFEEIPGPRPLPIIGNFWRFLPVIGNLGHIKRHEMFNRFYEQYGDICCLRGIPGRSPMVFLFNPDDIEAKQSAHCFQMMRNEGIWPTRNFFESSAYYKKVTRKEQFDGFAGISVENGKAWHDFRSVVNPVMMQPKVTKQYVSVIDRSADELLERVRYLTKQNPQSEMPEDFLNEIYKFTFESIVLIALDKRFGSLDSNTEQQREWQYVIAKINELFDLFYKLEVLPSFWKWFSTPDWKKFVRVNDEIRELFKRFVDEEAQKIDKGQKHADHNRELSVFEKLVAIDKKLALNMTIDMLTAGIDTTGRVIGAGLYYLSKNKQVQNKLRAELISLLPSKDDPITNEVLNQAHYLKASVKEALRLAPIAVGVNRVNPVDLVLSGYQIPKGSNLLSMHLTLSTATNKYFPRASEFLPERWLRETEGELSHKNVHPFVYMPFGFGVRTCIGRRFAPMEMEVAIAKLVRNLEFDWHHKDMEFDMFLLYGTADPLKFTVKEALK
ncbi:cytochrome p450 [Rhyzopertha dominica]|nr:cytochrome p450 [Rhyzopertha dominica]